MSELGREQSETALPGRHLRRSARDARVEGWVVEMRPDEAEAIADVLDAARVYVDEFIGRESHPGEDVAEGIALRTAINAFDRKVLQ